MLASLAAATIVMPIASGAGDSGTVEGAEALIASVATETVSETTGPSTLEVVLAEQAAQEAPAIVAEYDPLLERNLVAASRGVSRDVLPGCDLSVQVTSSNGQLRASELCDLWQSGHSLQPAAAVSFTALNDAFNAKFGVDLCVTDSYRALGSQVSLAATKPGLAATPGKSMHGWGLAVDLCGSSYGSKDVWNWLKANGPVYGWDNPAWARSGGSGAYEPWHWEYTAGVEAVTAKYGY